MTDTSSKNWILLRGLSRESGHWGNFPELLGRYFEPYEVHTLDLPGTGSYHGERSPASIASIMDRTRLRAQEKGLLSRPVYLMGLSLGGMVVWEWLQRHPGEIAGATIINSSLANVSPFYHRLRWQNYTNLIKIALQRNISERETAILQLVSNHNHYSATIADEWTKIQTERSISAGNTLNQIIAAARYHPPLAKPKPPVLVLSSQGDRLVSHICSKRIADIMGLPICVHPTAGHDLTMDDSFWVLECVKRWIEQLPSRH